MVDLAAFSAAPLTVNEKIQVTGPKGGNNSPGNVTVSTGASGGLVETIKLITLVAVNQLGTATYSNTGAGLGRITVADATGGGGNCYWLPWSEGRVYKMQLGAAKNLFFTYTLNGCGFMVAGPTNSPTVMHANADVPRLTAAVNVKDGAATARAQVAIYEQFYAGMTASMMSSNTFPSTSPASMLLPSTYLGADNGFAAVFGVCSSGNWKFYYNCRSRTRELWPKFDR